MQGSTKVAADKEMRRIIAERKRRPRGSARIANFWDSLIQADGKRAEDREHDEAADPDSEKFKAEFQESDGNRLMIGSE